MSKVPTMNETGIDPVETMDITKVVSSILTKTNPSQDETNIRAMFSKELSTLNNITGEEELQQDQSFIEAKKSLEDLKKDLIKLGQNIIPDVKTLFASQGITKDITPMLDTDAVAKKLANIADTVVKAKLASEHPLNIAINTWSRRFSDTMEQLEAQISGLKNEKNQIINTLLEQEDNLKNLRQNQGLAAPDLFVRNQLPDLIAQNKRSQEDLESIIKTVEERMNCLKFQELKSQYKEQYLALEKTFPTLQKNANQRADDKKIEAFLNDKSLASDSKQQLTLFHVSEENLGYFPKDVFSEEELRIRTFLAEKPSLYQGLKENAFLQSQIDSKDAPVFINSLSDPKFTLGKSHLCTADTDLGEEFNKHREASAQLQELSKLLMPILNKKIEDLTKGKVKDTSGRLELVEALKASISPEAIKHPIVCRDNFKAKLNDYESFYNKIYNDHSFIGAIKRFFNQLFPSTYVKVQKIMAEQRQGLFQPPADQDASSVNNAAATQQSIKQ